MSPGPAGMLRLHVPDALLRRCLGLRHGAAVNLTGTCGRDDHGSTRDNVRLMAEKKADCVLLELQASTMGSIFQSKLDDLWTAWISSVEVIQRTETTAEVDLKETVESDDQEDEIPSMEDDEVMKVEHSVINIAPLGDLNPVTLDDITMQPELGSPTSQVRTEAESASVTVAEELVSLLKCNNNNNPSQPLLRYKCQYCTQRFKYRSSRKHHEKFSCTNRVSGKACSHCNQVFDSRSDVESHEQSCVSRERFPCGLCGEVLLFSPAQRTKHMKSQCGKSTRTHICDLCGQGFVDKLRLQRHRTRKHPDTAEDLAEPPAPTFPCKFCLKPHTNGSTRHRHQMFHCAENPQRAKAVSCKHCGNLFPSEEELAAHQFRKHPSSGPLYVCHECGETLHSRSGVYLHKLRVHSDGPPRFPCPHCDKAYHTRAKLNKHAVRHTNLRPVQCEICGKQFKNAQQMASHRRTVHDNRYRYRCEQCGHGVDQLSYLASHKCGRVRRSQATSQDSPADTPTELDHTVLDAVLATHLGHLVTGADTTPGSGQTGRGAVSGGNQHTGIAGPGLHVNSTLGSNVGIPNGVQLKANFVTPNVNPHLLFEPNLARSHVVMPNAAASISGASILLPSLGGSGDPGTVVGPPGFQRSGGSKKMIVDSCSDARPQDLTLPPHEAYHDVDDSYVLLMD